MSTGGHDRTRWAWTSRRPVKRRMLTRLISLVAGAVLAVGAVGLGWQLAAISSAFRAASILVFLGVAPTAAIAGLLRTMDGFARLIIACTANIVLLALTAIIMLAEGIWSPTGGVLAVMAITVLCLVAQLPLVRLVRRGIRARIAAWHKAMEQLKIRLVDAAAAAESAADSAAESSVPVVPAAQAAPDAPSGADAPSASGADAPSVNAGPDAAG